MTTYSPAQQQAFNKYLQGKNIFITGPGGSGKSKLIKDIKLDCLTKNKKVQVCALTGCAALQLGIQAKTIHSWAGIGLANGPIDQIVSKINKSVFKKRNWQQIDVLIIDEVSMMCQKIFELLDTIAKKTRKNQNPFGGIQVIFSGDFYQLPPVGIKEEIETVRFCFESELWDKTFVKEDHVQLIEIFRQKDPVYATILNQIREGRIKRSSCEILEKCVNRPLSTSLNIIPTKLYPTRNKVDIINHTEMSKLTTEEIEFKQKETFDLPMTDKEMQLRHEYTRDAMQLEMTYIKRNLICEEVVRLKVGAQVMCIVNIELPNGTMICNGSQGIIISMTENKIPVVKFNDGTELLMNYHVWHSETIPGIGISQIPLILAWALTIHKSQGCTLDYAEIDVGNSIFECGQTYVALSRVKSLDGLYLTSFEPNKIRILKKVRDFYDAITMHPEK